MSSSIGKALKLTVFGQSHGEAIGMVLEGLPAGFLVDMEQLRQFLARRAPGSSALSTTRKEPDIPRFLSGLSEGHTCGAPLCAVIENSNTRSGDYANLRVLPRPGHADYTAEQKFGGFQDAAGGGHFSGRLTAPLCIAGGIALQLLRKNGISVGAHIRALAGIEDAPFDPMAPQLDAVSPAPVSVLCREAGSRMQQAILDAKAAGDSVGGIVECAVVGLPAGVGDPMFDGMENRLAAILFGIPAVKGVEFGSGFAAAAMTGSTHNDPFTVSDGRVVTTTNNAGGILGGITNGMPILFRCAFKPTPSIYRPQQTVNLQTMQPETLQIHGRHDPCIVTRAVPVVEAAAALAVCDALLEAGKLSV